LATRHSDGTICRKGTESVPTGFIPCCKVFKGHTKTCALDLRYEWWRKTRKWVIVIAESAGGGGIDIKYCPHCGSSLSATRVTR